MHDAAYTAKRKFPDIGASSRSLLLKRMLAGNTASCNTTDTRRPSELGRSSFASTGRKKGLSVVPDGMPPCYENNDDRAEDIDSLHQKRLFLYYFQTMQVLN